MRQGYHMGMGYYGSYILIFILVIFCMLIFLLLKSKKSLNLFVISLIDMLKGNYASGIITADEYIERKSIIEDIKYSSQYIPILLERYAQCTIGTKEFLNIKNEIESNNIDNLISARLAKGELSYDEFKSRMDSESL
ncbi:SHOCT domain-containing protein [Clostridium sp. BJN0001]|uniref:SHOCT domain-containing protein n=1 Tax=Clostridium sp. BJN0001 TaxID=2930219 RepID=UPI001FD45BC4|nr:SHOCT domain-containing protein [Clostridium sp. BJN0001]